MDDAVFKGPVLVAHPGAELYGSDRMVLESVRGLVEAHGNVVVSVPSGGPLVAELEAIGASVWRVPTLVLRKALTRPSGWFRLVATALVGALAAGRTLALVRPCVVYVSTVTIPLWPIVARCAGVPVVVHVHEAERDAPALFRWLLALPLRLADHVLVNSEFSRSVLADVLPSVAQRAEVVLNGIVGPWDGPFPGRADVRGAIRVLYLGRISQRKGANLAVEAVSRAVQDGLDVVMDLVGGVFSGYEQFEADVRRSVQARGLQERIRFHSFQEDVWHWIAEADVVIVPSIGTESFGNSAVEAVLGARPVIVADHSGLREAVAGYGAAQNVATNGPGAPEAWARALAVVREQWPQMRSAAVVDAERARLRHDPRRFGEKVAHAVLGKTRQGGTHE